ncbi:MAG: (Fe-S)-binding protein [Hyphomicrobium sp.]
MTAGAPRRPRVGLFVTCLVDVFRPSVGFAASRLIEASGCSVEVPAAQTCCGQPAYNSGARADARDLALATIRAFASFDYVVAPSGSCAAMLKMHYPELLAGDERLEAEAHAFSARVHELTEFLVRVRGLSRVASRCPATATYHDACSGLRELGIKTSPRKLLAGVEGLRLNEMKECETCCGFGGLFSVKYPAVSNAMAEKKLASATETRAELLLAGDLGCLMHIGGTMRRRGLPISCRHVAEVLAGELDDPPIGEPREAG